MGRVRLVQRHSHNLLVAHVVWATADRLPLLGGGADEWLARVLRRKAYEVGCALLASGNAADHVHVLLRYPSTVRVADAVHRLKGGSSYEWNAHRREPRLHWQGGYWAESLSPADLPVVTAYVERQRAHHGDALEREPWEAALTAGTEPRASDALSSRATKIVTPHDT